MKLKVERLMKELKPEVFMMNNNVIIIIKFKML